MELSYHHHSIHTFFLWTLSIKIYLEACFPFSACVWSGTWLSPLKQSGCCNGQRNLDWRNPAFSKLKIKATSCYFRCTERDPTEKQHVTPLWYYLSSRLNTNHAIQTSRTTRFTTLCFDYGSVTESILMLFLLPPDVALLPEPNRGCR